MGRELVAARQAEGIVLQGIVRALFLDAEDQVVKLKTSGFTLVIRLAPRKRER